LAAFRPHLERAGHTLELRPWPHRWWSWLRLGKALSHADAVILQRRLLQRWQLFLLRRAARLLLFDFDDAVFLRDSYARPGLHSARRLRRFAAVAGACDGLVAGNAFLQEHAARFADLTRIHVVPTCVEPELYPLAQHVRTSAGVQLVWVGSASTLRGLEVIRPLLEKLGQTYAGLRLKLVCDRFLSLGHLRVLSCPWSEETEAAHLATGDIGISWVPDDLWSRGKCALKVLQYMAAGLPVVANPVGVQAQIVRHGQTGFLARTDEEWVEAVGRLRSDPALRQRMGREGRRRVESEFSVRMGATRWTALLDGLRRSQAA
jgi:glycosyltransferase involved in cell wall biosynthesis